MATPNRRTQRASPQRKPGHPKLPKPEGDADTCSVEACGRPSYARGLCQTHHRQMLTTGKLKPIRAYRRRSPGTVKFAGLRLTPLCVEQVESYAERHEISPGAAIAAILEEWYADGGKQPG